MYLAGTAVKAAVVAVISWAEPNLRGEKRKVGNHAYTRICDTAEELQSNQIAVFKWVKRVLTAQAIAIACSRAQSTRIAREQSNLA